MQPGGHLVRRLRDARLGRIINQIDGLADGPADGRFESLVERATAIVAGDAETTMHLASVLAESDPAQAERLGDQAAQLAPDDPLMLLRVAGLMFDLANYDLARSLLSRSQELASVGFALHANQRHLDGRLTARDGGRRRATQLLTAAFEEDPDFPGHGIVLVSYLCETGQLAEARDVLDRSLRHHPDDSELADWRKFLDRGAPSKVWAAGLKLDIAAGSPIAETPEGTWWAFAHAHTEEDFLQQVADALSALNATMLSMRDVSSIEPAEDPVAFEDWPQGLSLNDVELFWRNDRD